jgi:hypothetical protein
VRQPLLGRRDRTPSSVAQQPEIGLAGQALALRAYFPDVRPRLFAGRLLWTGPIAPTPTSETYRVRLEAVAHREARLFVLEPLLVPDNRQRLPHVYPDGSLCLNLRHQWRPHMLFTDTVLPWASQWLLFYELWRVTGVWHGDDDTDNNAGAQDGILHIYTGPNALDFAWTAVHDRRALDARSTRW